MTTTDIAIPDYERFLDYITNAAEMQDSGESIVMRTLAAKTVEEALADDEAVHAREVLNRPLMVLGCRFLRSDFATDEGLPAYAVMECVTPQGESLAVTCGAARVMAALVKIIMLDGFPVAVRLVESERTTAKGYRVIKMVSAAKAFEDTEPF